MIFYLVETTLYNFTFLKYVIFYLNAFITNILMTIQHFIVWNFWSHIAEHLSSFSTETQILHFLNNQENL